MSTSITDTLRAQQWRERIAQHVATDRSAPLEACQCLAAPLAIKVALDVHNAKVLEQNFSEARMLTSSGTVD